jgi:RecB family endonuclease NucS
MLEKDIEILVAKYPEEFLPDKELKLLGEQVRLGPYFADIIFEDKQQNKIIVEIKRGILSREAISQIMDYYGVIKLKEPSSNIRLIIMANVIPKERVIPQHSEDEMRQSNLDGVHNGLSHGPR